jgi:hypothetical protein
MTAELQCVHCSAPVGLLGGHYRCMPCGEPPLRCRCPQTSARLAVLMPADDPLRHFQPWE